MRMPVKLLGRGDWCRTEFGFMGWPQLTDTVKLLGRQLIDDADEMRMAVSAFSCILLHLYLPHSSV